MNHITFILSLYVYAQDQLMPLGPGLQWTVKNKKFHKKIMLVQENSSFEALQWISWLESSLKNKNGQSVTLDHAYHRGEKKIKQWKVDAFACVDGVNYYYEYHGEFNYNL